MVKRNRFVLIRLKELGNNNYSEGKRLISTFSSPGYFSREKFLKTHALDLEIKGTADTFLLIDASADRVVGFFTVNAGIKCAYDKPVFEISHLCVGEGCHPQYLRKFLEMVVDMFGRCTEKLGPMNVTARCTDGELETYEKAGFAYLGKTLGNLNRVILYT